MRYDAKKKAEVVAFVKEHNAKNGRGGQSAARKKYGITAVTIAKWLTEAGEELPGKGGPKRGGKKKATRKGGRPKGSKNKRPAKKKSAGRAKAGAASGASLTAKLDRLSAIAKEIESLQAEFDSLKNSL